MTMFIQVDATGAGSGSVKPDTGFLELQLIANNDPELVLEPQVGNRQQITYNRTDPGIPPMRLDQLVNTAFTPDYGNGPRAVNIIVVPAGPNFVLNDGVLVTNVAGTALPPSDSGLPGAGLNPTNDCLVIYDTSQNDGDGYCVARDGAEEALDLSLPGSVILYHELSHAFRIVNNTLQQLGGPCNPASPEESAAITDENDQRNQLAVMKNVSPVLRDPGIHCGVGGPCFVVEGGGGECCFAVLVAAGSSLATEVNLLRSLRDGMLRKTEVGFSFFQKLHYDYYGFSPQVCTLLVRHPALRSLVLEGFVRPLVITLQLIERYGLGKCEAEALGQAFVANHPDREVAATRLAMLARARELLSGTDVRLTDEEWKLAELLDPAFMSEHVNWALIEPLEIYEGALRLYLTESDVARVNAQLLDDINAWAGRLPLDDVWRSLAVAELGNELKALDTVLLRTPEVRLSFRDRLKVKFRDVRQLVTFLNLEQGVNP